jgi:[ribosomal protein S5]-alanine N-acetyltransferase
VQACPFLGERASGPAYRDAVTPPETARLRLREMRSSDVDDLLAIFGDPVAMEFYPSTKSRREVQDWIAANHERYRRDGFGLWTVERKADGRVLGDCGITLQPVEGVLVPEIGYHIVRSEWRQGYATEAATACRDWFFAATPGDHVVSIVDPRNLASREVAERVHARLRMFRWERAGRREMCLYETDRASVDATTGG